MDKRYERNVPALSEEECKKLQASRILIAGCGGLGGHLCELMARIGVGEICVIDGDCFETSNLNRQVLSSPNLIGSSKSEAAANRIRLIDPTIKVVSVHTFLTEDNAEDLLRGYDVVLDALDNIAGRRVLSSTCAKLNIPLIYGAVGGWVAQAAISMPKDQLIELLYPEDTVLKDKSILSFTPALCASMQASLCVRLLTGRSVETGIIYYYDLLEQEFERIPMTL